MTTLMPTDEQPGTEQQGQNPCEAGGVSPAGTGARGHCEWDGQSARCWCYDPDTDEYYCEGTGTCVDLAGEGLLP